MLTKIWCFTVRKLPCTRHTGTYRHLPILVSAYRRLSRETMLRIVAISQSFHTFCLAITVEEPGSLWGAVSYLSYLSPIKTIIQKNQQSSYRSVIVLASLLSNTSFLDMALHSMKPSSHSDKKSWITKKSHRVAKASTYWMTTLIAQNVRLI